MDMYWTQYLHAQDRSVGGTHSANSLGVPATRQGFLSADVTSLSSKAVAFADKKPRPKAGYCKAIFGMSSHILTTQKHTQLINYITSTLQYCCRDLTSI